MKPESAGLDDYALLVLERLRTCADAQRARDLMAEIATALEGLHVGPETSKQFWENLKRDLDAAQDATHLLSLNEAAVRSAVIAAAQSEAAMYALLAESRD